MAPSKGRPPIENPKSGRLDIRVTPQEKTEIKKFTADHNCTLLELIREGMRAVEERDNSGKS